MAEFKTIDERAFREAQARGRSRVGLRALSASFAEKDRRIVVTVETGAVFRFDPAAVPELRDASAGDLAAVEVAGVGYGIYFAHCDLDISMTRVVALFDATQDIQGVLTS